MVTMINKRKIPPVTNPVILIKRDVDSIPYAGAKKTSLMIPLQIIARNIKPTMDHMFKGVA